MFPGHKIVIVSHGVSYFAGETYALVDWVGEESSSVVQGIRVAGGFVRVGEVSKIRVSGGVFDGLVIASGKNHRSVVIHFTCIIFIGTKQEMEHLLKRRVVDEGQGEKEGGMEGQGEIEDGTSRRDRGGGWKDNER